MIRIRALSLSLCPALTLAQHHRCHSLFVFLDTHLICPIAILILILKKSTAQEEGTRGGEEKEKGYGGPRDWSKENDEHG